MYKTKNTDLKAKLAAINSRGKLTSEGRRRVIILSSINAGQGTLDAESIKAGAYVRNKDAKNRIRL